MSITTKIRNTPSEKWLVHTERHHDAKVTGKMDLNAPHPKMHPKKKSKNLVQGTKSANETKAP